MDNLKEEINKELLLEILETLTKIRKDFPYTILLHVLPQSQVMKLLDIFQGTTVTFPTQKELMDCVTFAITVKYGGYDQTPKELLNGFTRTRYKELLSAYNRLD